MPEHVRAFLVELGIADQPHSGRTFLEHLEGTYELLKQHGETIALAGALHSVYGGHRPFKPRNIPTREQVKAVIGEDAEWLVHCFCWLPPVRYETVPPETAHNLRLIQAANDEEQRGKR